MLCICKHSFGKNDDKAASRGIGNAIVLAITSGIICAILYYIFCDPLIVIFGGTVNDETFVYAREYFLRIAAGIPFYVFGQAMNPVIRADGSPNFAMVTTLVGAVINLILDPIFIFGFYWGMTGAAVATVVGQITTAAFAVYYLFHTKLVKITKRSFHLKAKVIGRFISLGVCSFLAQISLVAAMAAVNNMIRKYGALDPIFGQQQYAQIPMAVVGIVMKFFQIVISIVIGMAAGCIPIVGYNMGADRNDRVRKLFELLLIAEAIVGAISFIIVEFFPKQLISVFGAANESVYYTEFAEKAFRIYLCMIILACVNKAVSIFLQSMGKAIASTFLSMVCEIVFGVGLALILPIFYGLDGVLYSMPVADILTFVITIILVLLTDSALRTRLVSDTSKDVEQMSVQQ